MHIYTSYLYNTYIYIYIYSIIFAMRAGGGWRSAVPAGSHTML